MTKMVSKQTSHRSKQIFNCTCTSGKRFELCCGRFLSGSEFAKTPEQLMRSRYSAYALGGYGQYLIDTWLPAKTVGMSAAELSMRTTNWSGLEILTKSKQGEQGIVSFNAHFVDTDGTALTHHEQSLFQRIKGRWYYSHALSVETPAS